MPLPLNLPALLHGKTVEWERLELKAGWNPLAALQTICAFANDFHNFGGGYLVIGVAESNGRPILPPAGLSAQQMDTIQKELLELGHSSMQPAYHPIVAPYVLERRQILVIWAMGGQTRPYKAKLALGKEHKDYAYFIRKGSSTVRARGTDEIELLSLAATVPFDDRLNQRARVEDLSRDLMMDFLREVGSTLADTAAALSLTELGRQMNVVGGQPEAALPLNVGLLLFSPDPQRFFPATQIDVVWFGDGPGSDKFTEKIFRGPLARMVREALAFIARNYIYEIVMKHPDRAEATRVNNFPYGAIEEAVVNAIYHRSYEEREPIEVRITPNDLVVLSYPGPDRSVRLLQLRAGRAMPRRYRNRRVGEFLKELNLTEGRATGIPKIIKAMRDNGSPPPEFEFDEDHAYFQVRLPVHDGLTEQDVLRADAQFYEFTGNRSETTPGTPVEVTVETASVTVETAEVTVETADVTVETADVTVETADVTVEIADVTVEISDVTVEMAGERRVLPAQILALLHAEPTLTLAEVAQKLDVSRSTVERTATRLTKLGRLKFNGPRKRGMWQVLVVENR